MSDGRVGVRAERGWAETTDGREFDFISISAVNSGRLGTEISVFDFVHPGGVLSLIDYPRGRHSASLPVGLAPGERATFMVVLNTLAVDCLTQDIDPRKLKPRVMAGSKAVKGSMSLSAMELLRRKMKEVEGNL